MSVCSVWFFPLFPGPSCFASYPMVLMCNDTYTHTPKNTSQEICRWLWEYFKWRFEMGISYENLLRCSFCQWYPDIWSVCGVCVSAPWTTWWDAWLRRCATPIWQAAFKPSTRHLWTQRPPAAVRTILSFILSVFHWTFCLSVILSITLVSPCPSGCQSFSPSYTFTVTFGRERYNNRKIL